MSSSETGFGGNESPMISEANAMAVFYRGRRWLSKNKNGAFKAYTHEGFIFIPIITAEKEKAIENNHKACLHFFWPNLERQIIIKADLEKVAENLKRWLFPFKTERKSAWSCGSPQKPEIPNREFLEDKLKELEKEFEHTEVPRPANWGGYLARPYEIEFWQEDPIVFMIGLFMSLKTLTGKISRLAP